MTQNRQALTKGKPPAGFDIDLPLSDSDNTFSILFCGLPARSTGVVNLRLLTGTTAYVLTEKRLAKESDGSGGGSSVYRMCDTANLPLGCFHVKAGRNYWVMHVDSTATRPSSMLPTPLSQQRQHEQQGGGGDVPTAVMAAEDKDEEENATLADLLLRSTHPSQAEKRASKREGKRSRKHQQPQKEQEKQTAVPGATTGVQAPHTTTAADGGADSADPLVSEVFTAMEAAGTATESHVAAAVDEEADVVADVEASLADLFVSPSPHAPAAKRANTTAAAAEEESAEPTARKRSRTERHTAKAAEMAASPSAVQDGDDGVAARADTAKKPPKKRQKKQQGKLTEAAVAECAPPPPTSSPSATTPAEGAEAPPAAPSKNEKRAVTSEGTRVRDGPPTPPSPSPSLDDSPLPATSTSPPQPRRPAAQPAQPDKRAEAEKVSVVTAPSVASGMQSPAIRPPLSPHRVGAPEAVQAWPSSRSPVHSETSPTVQYSHRNSGPVTAPLTSPHLRRHQQQFSGSSGVGGKEESGGWSPPGAEVGRAGFVLSESPALGFTQVQSSLAEEFSLDPSASVASSDASVRYLDMEE